jgi:hypothetical protein
VAIVEFFVEDDTMYRNGQHPRARAVDEWGLMHVYSVEHASRPDFEVVGGLPEDWTVDALRQEPRITT